MVDCIPDFANAPFAFYRYVPSRAAAIAFAALFIITTLLHFAQMLRTRTWYMTALIIGGICESIGYIGRIINTFEDPGCWSLGPYIVSTILVLIGPAFMAASIYMVLGRIITLTEGEHHSLIRRRWLTKLFVLGDVISLFLQASGAGKLSSKNHDDVANGERTIIIGLGVQLAFFGCFLLVSSVFHWRLRNAPTCKSDKPYIRWQVYMSALYIASVLVLVRSVFRVVEYVQGNSGYLISHEVFIFVFDGALMALVLGWLNWWHPAEIGILLRGDVPPTNGIALLWSTSTRSRKGVEGASSEHELV